MTARLDLADGAEFSQTLFRNAKRELELAHARWWAPGPHDTGATGHAEQRRYAARAVSMTAAAVYDWITWALLATKVPLPAVEPHGPHCALQRWQALPLAAQSLHRPHQFTLTPQQQTLVCDLGLWHAAISYTDPTAQAQVRERLVAQRVLARRQSGTQLMRTPDADVLLAEAGRLFDWAHHATGLPTPS